MKALEQGAKAIDDLTDQTTDAVFLSDSRSALDALHNQSEPHLSRILHSIIGRRRVVLQWIPAYCGISGNEMTDKLAKKAAAMTQHDNPVTPAEKKTINKHSFKTKKFHDNHHKLDIAGHNSASPHGTQQVELTHA